MLALPLNAAGRLRSRIAAAVPWTKAGLVLGFASVLQDASACLERSHNRIDTVPIAPTSPPAFIVVPAISRSNRRETRAARRATRQPHCCSARARIT